MIEEGNPMVGCGEGAINAPRGYKRENRRMTFDEFQELNARRCREIWHKELRDWTLDDWAHALSAEVGELSEVFVRVKQNRLPLTEKRNALLSELADVIAFADLMITALQANTQDAVMRKFEEVSERHEWTPLFATRGAR